MSKLVVPLKWLGAKHYVYKLIHYEIKLHKLWIEPFVGGGVTTLMKPPSEDEVICDTNPSLINFYYYSKYFPEEVYELANREYCEDSFHWAADYATEPNFIVAAAKYLVRNRMSRDGGFQSYAWSDRPRRGMPENVSAFKNVLENWFVFVERLKQITSIFNEDGLTALNAFKDRKDACFYLDPPYPLESRPSKKLYGEFEVARTVEEDRLWHHTMLELALSCEGQVIISSYHTELYDRLLKDWRCIEKPITVKMGGTLENGRKGKRVEVIYTNR
jgi:DNA adenine methylase